MSLAHLDCTSAPFDGTPDAPTRQGHILLILPWAKTLPEDLPARSQCLAVLKRRRIKVQELAKTPIALDLPEGGRLACVMLDPKADTYSRLSTLRKSAALLLEESPDEITLAFAGKDARAEEYKSLLDDALYVLWANGASLPVCKKKPAKALRRIRLHTPFSVEDFSDVAAQASANLLARQLTALPPNTLTPAHYREKIRTLAKQRGWQIEEFDFRTLRKMGAGAFCAVAQGSAEHDAAIVHLSWRGPDARQRVALVGKGICFDTGGHNLKPARYMAGMHEDMNGSAIALALLQLLQDRGLPLQIDAWLAIAQNHLSPEAYKQDDIITTLDGTHVEIVHTDAEGRLVLADTLTLATRAEKIAGKSKPKTRNKAEKPEKSETPDLVIDFATLTGSMMTALGTRYAGVFASQESLASLAVRAGKQSGERVCVFPMDEDYETALDSKVADIRQCTLEGEADHILAARFLKRFTHEVPWLHVDLSAARCSGGLGAIASDLTGFGVAWGGEMLAQWLSSSSEKS